MQTLAPSSATRESSHRSTGSQAEAERATATSERAALQALLRQVEDRAYVEVDRGRQELKALKAQLTAQAREHAVALRAAEQDKRRIEAALHKAQRDLAAARARPAAGPKTAPVRAPARRKTRKVDADAPR